MRIGIDISQIAYDGTGVGQYLVNLVEQMLNKDRENEYVFFFSSLRKTIKNAKFKSTIQKHNSKVKIKSFRIPPTLLDLLWNKLHLLPIEWFVGDIDLFISSDWTQPPLKKAKGVTIIYDLIVFKYPQETDIKIVETQKRRLKWAVKECEKIICISEATKRDALDILKIPETRLEVVKPGI